MAKVPCVCTADFCNHPLGQPCGQEVAAILKTKVAMGSGQFSPEKETGLCEGCWRRIQDNYPWMFGSQ